MIYSVELFCCFNFQLCTFLLPADGFFQLGSLFLSGCSGHGILVGNKLVHINFSLAFLQKIRGHGTSASYILNYYGGTNDRDSDPLTLNNP